MKIVLLPGVSDLNKQWADMWERAFVQNGYEVYKQYYDHWGTDKMFSFENETKKLSSLDPSWKAAIVVGKSIGTLLTMYAIHEGIILPSRAIFLGFPSNMNGEDNGNIKIDLTTWLKSYSTPTQIFQNEQDPVTSFQEAKNFIENTSSIKISGVPGNTHKYVPEVFLGRVINACK